MYTVIRIWVAIALLGAGALGFLAANVDPSVAVRPDVRIHGASAEQIDLGRWAVRRFEEAGLDAPAVEIHFHGRTAGCGGHLGYAKAGRVDVCTTLVNAMTRRTLLHEMGHVWLDVNADASVRERFLEFRGLREWNAGGDPWEQRGYEQGAEIVSWVIGDRILGAQIPDNDPLVLEAAFEILTGVSSPAR